MPLASANLDVRRKLAGSSQDMSFVVRLSCKLSFPASSLAVRSAIVPSVSNGWPSVRHFAAKKTADKDEKEKKGGKGKGDGSAKEKKGGGTSKKFRPPGEGQGEIDAIYKFLHACEDAKK